MKRLNSKGNAIEKIIIIFLVCVVIAAVLIFIFKVDIISYIRNLPGYSYDNNDKVIELTPDKLMALGFKCNEKVARVESKPVSGDKHNLLIYRHGSYEKTGLFARIEGADSVKILMPTYLGFSSSEVGKVENKKLIISAKYESISKYITQEEFNKLNNALFIKVSVQISFCTYKEKAVNEFE